MFHSYLDGKGNRLVSVNGNLIRGPILWANVEQGLVCYVPHPIRFNKQKGEVHTRLLRGEVEVVFSESGITGHRADFFIMDELCEH